MGYSYYRYFLYVWIPRWSCYWPCELYATKAYALKSASKKGFTDFYIKRIIPGLNDDDSTKFYLDHCQHLDHIRFSPVEVSE